MYTPRLLSRERRRGRKREREREKSHKDRARRCRGVGVRRKTGGEDDSSGHYYDNTGASPRSFARALAFAFPRLFARFFYSPHLFLSLSARARARVYIHVRVIRLLLQPAPFSLPAASLGSVPAELRRALNFFGCLHVDVTDTIDNGRKLKGTGVRLAGMKSPPSQSLSLLDGKDSPRV